MAVPRIWPSSLQGHRPPVNERDTLRTVIAISLSARMSQCGPGVAMKISSFNAAVLKVPDDFEDLDTTENLAGIIFLMLPCCDVRGGGRLKRHCLDA